MGTTSRARSRLRNPAEARDAAPGIDTADQLAEAEKALRDAETRLNDIRRQAREDARADQQDAADQRLRAGKAQAAEKATEEQKRATDSIVDYASERFADLFSSTGKGWAWVLGSGASSQVDLRGD